MTIRRNRATNPRVAVDLTNLAAGQSTGTPTYARIPAGTAGGPLPSLSAFVRANVVGIPTYVDVYHSGVGSNVVTPGETVTFSAYGRASTASSTTGVDAYLQWIDGAGSVMPTGTTVSTSSTKTGWGRYSVTATVPPGAARARVILRLKATSGTLTDGDRWDVTGFLVESGAVLLPWFDGDSGVWYSWTGTPGLSASVWYSPSITLTPTLTPDPCPRVEVLVTDLPTIVTTVDVYRLAGNREYPVRGGVKVAVTGALTRIDFEVPFGIQVAYRIEMFNAAGASLGFSDSFTTFLDVKETWVHNPLDPQGATTVMFRGERPPAWQRPVEGDVVWPMGRTVGVVVAGQRRGLQDAVLDVVVDTTDQADRLQNMFGSYGERTVPVICFRIGSQARLRLPRPLFAGILTLSEEDMTYEIGGETIGFGMTGSEVSPPTPALVVPLLTRADLNAYYPTRAALNTDNFTRLAVNRRYDLAGNGS